MVAAGYAVRVPADTPDRLRAALAGVRGLLLDLDGVLVVAGEAVPGAVEALRVLNRRQFPYRIVTNTSLVSRRTLSRSAAALGVDVPAARFHSALSISAAWTAAHAPGEPLYVLASEDALSEFAGQRVLSAAEADAADARVAAVVVGDSPEAVTFDNLNRAFRLVRGGAALVGMHKNRWWLTPSGPTIDSGAIVAGLEFATGVRARILGKPSSDFFRLVASEVAEEAAAVAARASAAVAARASAAVTTRASAAVAARAPAAIGGADRRVVRRRDLAMVGDDLWTDVFAGRRAGLRGIFVLSGKHGEEELAAAATRRRGGTRPDAVAASLAEVVAALDWGPDPSRPAARWSRSQPEDDFR